MIHPVEPKKVLCIHDLSGMGRCSLAVILPVLSIMGVQPVALPTVVLSTHTGGLGTPARLDGCAYGEQALEHYHALGVEFDCIYTGYLGGEDQVALAEKAFALWPAAKKIVDPVMGDNGKAYSTVTPALIDRIRALCGAADLILPNYTEAQILLQRQPQTELLTDEAAQALADELTTLAPGAVVTGLPLGSSWRFPSRTRPPRRIPATGSGSSRFCRACARQARQNKGRYTDERKANLEHRSGGAAHPAEHRQCGPHLCLHCLSATSGRPHGLCHR